MTVRKNASAMRQETVVAGNANEPRLTPELRERLRRMALKQSKPVDTVLCDAVQDYWVRFATRNRLPPSEW